ncbi:MAG TPA: GldG family protein, partial [Verrucomicrobiae bacterium]
MSANPKSRPSFSPASRWKIGFDVALRTALVLAVVVMVNYVGANFFHRFYLSSQTRVALSPRTLSLLRSVTNMVNVTLYYDRKDEFMPDVVALLNEYRAANKNISIRIVDFVSDAGEAEKVKEQYKLGGATDKNLVIFDSNGRVKIAAGDALTQYTLEQLPNEKEREFRRKPVSFAGEKMFTAMLLSLQNPQPLKAYFLQGDGEPSLNDDGNFGYMKFGSTLEQNYVTVTNLELLAEKSTVPMDCNLLVIAAPAAPFTEMELEKIAKYLEEGGRLFLLFNYSSLKHATGLEPILQRWGVNVRADIVEDPDNTVTHQDVVVRRFSDHPIVNALTDYSLQMVLPRPVQKINIANPPASAPQVAELVFSSPASSLVSDRSEAPQSYSLAAAVEQTPVAGVANPRGNTRIIVAGDSIFLCNRWIEAGANRDFLNGAANWLLDRPQLLEGIGPRPVTEFRLLLTEHQQQQLRWLLLGALPGGVLFFGWLVW